MTSFLVLSWAVSFTLRHSATPSLQFLITQVLHDVESRWDIEVSYGSIEPYIFPFVKIKHVELRDAQGGFVVYVGEGVLTYSALALLRGDASSLLKKIELTDVHVFWTTHETHPSEGPALPHSRRTASLSLQRVLSSLPPEVLIRRGSFQMVLPDESRIMGRDVRVDIAPGNDGSARYSLSASLFLDISHETAAYYEGVLPERTFLVPVRARGTFSPDMPSMEMELSCSLQGSRIELSTQRFLLSVRNDALSFQNLQASVPYDILGEYEWSSSTLNLMVLTEDFQPSSQFRGPLLESMPANLKFFLDATYSTHLQISYHLPARTLRYTGSGSASFLSKDLHSIAFSLDGENSRIHLDYLTAFTRYGRASMEGLLDIHPFSFQGRLHISEARSPGMSSFESMSGRFNVNISGSNETIKGYAFSGDASWGGFELSRAELSFEGDIVRQEYTLNVLLLPRKGEGYVYGETHLFPSSGPSSLRGQGLLLFRDLSLSDLTLALSGSQRRWHPIIPEQATIRGALEFDFDASRYRVSSMEDIVLSISEEADASLTLSLTPDQLSLSSSGTLYTVPFQGTFSLALRDTQRFSGELLVENILYRFSGILQEKEFSLSGDNLTFLLEEKEGRWVFRGKTRTLPLPMMRGQSSPQVSVDLSGEFHTTDEWWIYVPYLRVTDLFLLPSVRGNLSGRIAIDPSGIEAFDLSYGDSYSNLEGSMSLVLPEGLEGLLTRRRLAGELVLQSKTTRERYGLQADISSSRIDLSAYAREAPLGRWTEEKARGRLTATVNLEGPWNDPDLEGTVTLTEGSVNGIPLAANGSFEKSSSTMSISLSELLLAQHRLSGFHLTYDLSSGTFRGETDLSLAVGRTTQSTPVSLYGTMEQRFDDLSPFLHSLPSLSCTGSLVLHKVSLVEGQPVWRFLFAYTPAGVTLRGGPSNAASLAFSFEDGALDASFSSPLPLQGSIKGTIREEHLSLTLAFSRIDVESFQPLFDLGVVRIREGILTGEVSLEGDPRDPTLTGNLEGRELRGVFFLVPEEISSERLKLEFQGEGFQILPSRITAGDATVILSGAFTREAWSLPFFQISIATLSPNRLHILYDFGTLQVDGYAAGFVTIEQTPQSLSIAGDILAESTVVTLAQRRTEAPGKGEPVPLEIDLRIQSGPDVQFVWPTRTLPILRLYADTGERLRYTAHGGEGSFSLEGNIGLRGGEVFYFERSFYVREGSILFQENQDKFDPRITVRAEMRDFYKGDPIRIYLVSYNTPLSQFSPRFESDPPLPPEDLNIVLGQRFNEEFAEGFLSPVSLVGLTTDLVSQFALMREFETSVKKTFGLDVFSVRTHLFQNVLESALQSPEYPLDRQSPSLGKYLDNTTILVGKYLGSDVFLESLFQIAAENPLASEVRSFGGFEVNVEVTVEWNTPFFLLSWKFAPEHPEELFIPDQTISLKWRFTY